MVLSEFVDRGRIIDAHEEVKSKMFGKVANDTQSVICDRQNQILKAFVEADGLVKVIHLFPTQPASHFLSVLKDFTLYDCF